MEYPGKALVKKRHPSAKLEDVSLNGTHYQILIPDEQGEEESIGCGSSPMEAWHDAALACGMKGED